MNGLQRKHDIILIAEQGTKPRCGLGYNVMPAATLQKNDFTYEDHAANCFEHEAHESA
jgi:hypothetical protein